MYCTHSPFKVTLFSFLISLLAVFNTALAVQDVLETPAAKTELADENLLLDVAAAGQRLVAVGERGHIIVSDDQGKSWRQVSVPVAVLLTAVSFADEQHGWAVGHGGVVLHTKDGGETWVKQFDGNIANQMIIKQAETYVEELEEELANADEEDALDAEYALEDAQFALEDAQIDAEVGASKPLLDVLFWSRTEGVVVGAYGFIFKTEDGGSTWRNLGSNMDNADRFHLNAVTQIKGGTLLAAGEAGVLFRSTDLGESWESIDSPYDGSFFGVSATGEEGTALAFGLRGNLFRTTDDGVSWEELDSNTESTLMGASFDGDNGITIVGNSGSVLRSRDGGMTFNETIRENRLGNVSVIHISEDKLVMVGESGVNITTPAGKNI